MSRTKAIPLSVPLFNGNEWKYLKDCLDAGWVSSAGQYVARFEEAICSYTKAKYAVACVNGTAALHLSLILLGIKAGEEVIAPTVTFIAPINAVKYVGAEPVFMDCDDYLNIDVEKTNDFIKKECCFKKGKLTNKTSGRTVKAIIPVHIFGHPVDMEPLIDLAEKYNLMIIEDATESLGSGYTAREYKGRKTGTIGDIGCLSFNGNKLITTGGGGMIITNDKKTARKAKYLTTQAKDDEVKYVHNEIGYNYRLTNLQAALGVAQLEKLSEYIERKRTNFRAYLRGISDIIGLNLITEPAGTFSNYWFYSLVVDKNKYGLSNLDLMRVLAEKKIQTRPIWHLNHKQKPYIKSQSHRIEKAIKLFDSVLNLPCSVNLTQQDIERILQVIKKYA